MPVAKKQIEQTEDQPKKKSTITWDSNLWDDLEEYRERENRTSVSNASETILLAFFDAFKDGNVEALRRLLPNCDIK